MGWFLALFASLGLWFGGIMGQQPRVEQQNSDEVKLQHQQNKNERYVRKFFESYPEVIEHLDDNDIQNLLTWACWLDAHAFDEDLNDHEMVNLPIDHELELYLTSQIIPIRKLARSFAH